MAVIEFRKSRLVNTDPQRRCYDGCHFSSEIQWGEWESLESGLDDHEVEGRLGFWRGLSEYAAKERGQPISTEYRLKKEN